MLALYALPSVANLADLWAAHAKQFSRFFVGEGGFKNRLNISRAKSAVPMFLASRLAAFIRTVFVVVPASPLAQMAWVDTARRIARVKKNLAVRYFPDKELVRKAMRPDWSALDNEYPVPVIIATALPKPASIAFVKLPQKGILCRWKRELIQAASTSHLHITRAAKIAPGEWFHPANFAPHGISFVEQRQHCAIRMEY